MASSPPGDRERDSASATGAARASASASRARARARRRRARARDRDRDRRRRRRAGRGRSAAAALSSPLTLALSARRALGVREAVIDGCGAPRGAAARAASSRSRRRSRRAPPAAARGRRASPRPAPRARLAGGRRSRARGREPLSSPSLLSFVSSLSSPSRCSPFLRDDAESSSDAIALDGVCAKALLQQTNLASEATDVPLPPMTAIQRCAGRRIRTSSTGEWRKKSARKTRASGVTH